MNLQNASLRDGYRKNHMLQPVPKTIPGKRAGFRVKKLSGCQFKDRAMMMNLFDGAAGTGVTVRIFVTEEFMNVNTGCQDLQKKEQQQPGYDPANKNRVYREEVLP